MGKSTAQRRSAGPGKTLGVPTAEGFAVGDFQELQRLAYQYAGITVPDNRRQLAYARLSRRMQALGLAEFPSYFQRVHENQQGERQHFIHAITTHFTRFFREDEQLNLLQDLVTGSWGRERRGLQIWSAGCSTGEEAYSIAMVLATCFGRIATNDFRVFGSDVDRRVVDIAARGIYPEAAKRNIPSAYRKFLLQGTGGNRGRVRVSAELTALVEFGITNLNGPWPKRCYDAIFCRNVMIYFSDEQTAHILARFAAQLRPDGYLFIGHSERIGATRILFEPCGRNVFRVRKSP